MFEMFLVGIHLCIPLPAPDRKHTGEEPNHVSLKYLDQIKLFTAEDVFFAYLSPDR